MPLLLNLLSKDTRHGLSRDVELLTDVFRSAGHVCRFVQWPARAPRADVNIHVELVSLANVPQARWNVAIPNPEYMRPAWRPLLRDFDAVWSKCKATHETMVKLGARSVLTGFVSRDLRDRSVPKARFALHVRGGSTIRGTAAILEAWSRFGRWLPELVIVTADRIELPGSLRGSRRVRVFQGHTSEMHLRWLMNAARFYVYPSEADGWAHTIPEALSTGSIVVTTDASPMCEHVDARFAGLIASKAEDRGSFASHRVSPIDVAEQVRMFAGMKECRLDELGADGRAFMLERNAKGRASLLRALGEMTG